MSRHMKPENVRRYFKPSPEAIAEVARLLAPGDARRGAVLSWTGWCAERGCEQRFL
jgi:hypothetical protein